MVQQLTFNPAAPFSTDAFSLGHVGVFAGAVIALGFQGVLSPSPASHRWLVLRWCHTELFVWLLLTEV